MDTTRSADLRQTLADALGASRRPSVLWPWVLALTAVIAGWFLLSQPVDTGPRFRTAIVTEGDLTVSVTATGELQSATTINVGTETSGVIDRVAVDFNSSVSVGQLLATINTEKLDAQARQARAALAASQARWVRAGATLAEARRHFERLTQLFTLTNGGAPSRQEMTAQQAALAVAQAELAAQEAEVAQSEANLTAIETDIRRATIRSPIRGIVLDRRADPGQTVAASFQTPTLFVLVEDLTRMRLLVDVDEADVGRVYAGQLASFAVDAYPRRSFQSAVAEVRSTPARSNGVVTYQVVLSVDNSELLLKPGMTATAEIVVARAHRATLVPTAALRFTPPAESEGKSLFTGPPDGARVTTDDPRTRVWTLAGVQATPIDVVVGETDGQFTQVSGGHVRPGDIVIVDIVPAGK